MNSKLYHRLDVLFKALCVVAAFAMVAYWIYKFTLDEDISLVDYKPIKEENDIHYPEVSLCFQYLGPLHENVSSIDFTKVSIDVDGYYIGTAVVWKNGSIALVKSSKPYLSFSGFKYGRFMKCYSVLTTQMDWKEVKYIDHMYNIDLYSKHFHPSTGGVVARIHQPNQFVATDDAQYLSSSMNTSNGVSLGILLTSFEVLKRRNKGREPCVENWNDFDNIYINDHVAGFGCIPPYFEPYNDFSVCSDENTIEESRFEVSRIRSKESYHPPCQGMSKIDYDFFNNFPTKKGFLKIMIGYPEQVKIITQYQAVDGNTIIANIGGYIGLFLGKPQE